jgi:hypothetical protein
MGRSYGRIAKTPRKTTTKPTRGGTSFKIVILNKDGSPLSMSEIRDGCYEAVRKLFGDGRCHRAKRFAIYVTVVGHDGKEFLPDPSGEWEINPYKSAADEHGA